MGRPRKAPVTQSAEKIEDVDFIRLVDTIRKSRNRVKIETAFNEIVRRMSPKIQKISFQFNIPGFSHDDVLQESLQALRYKAIKDYDRDHETQSEGPYPFDKFAILCIRRHLSTKLKSSFQNKNKALNKSISLDQDRGDSSGDNVLPLSDIVPKTEGTVLGSIERIEYFKNLFTRLFEKLSGFEKKVMLLYVQKYSYEQISKIINKRTGKRIADIKAVDNGLSRIKLKAKEIIESMEKK